MELTKIYTHNNKDNYEFLLSLGCLSLFANYEEHCQFNDGKFIGIMDDGCLTIFDTLVDNWDFIENIESYTKK